MPYRVYLAARYGRRDELNGYRQRLHGDGFEVTSHWLTADPPSPIAELTDAHDIRRADALVAFAEEAEGGGGGRHVELGIALGKLVIVLGRPEHLFHRLPQVRVALDWDDAPATLREAASRAG